ncbi:uncharacterized protein CMC5_061810 [Chondromyces crocatus]|uniref:FHA domain-containing protein n=2 Tax=Chondromyces crocatus TaxID=52 RepID=A0A0K1EM68_CHOCO|nr:uncharacterized protein CMC5_061810 [Chondromyces crocatus]
MEGGHPIALDNDSFGNDAYGPTAYAPQGGGFGAEPYPAPPPAGIPPLPPGGPSATPGAPRAVPAAEPPKDRAALAGFLISFQDDPLGKHWVLYQGKNLIGRAETGQKVDVPVAHGTTSTHHATIDCEGGRMILSDLGSTNGTFHNEEAIGFQGRRELRDGDRIRFGGFSVIVINVATRS